MEGLVRIRYFSLCFFAITDPRYSDIGRQTINKKADQNMQIKIGRLKYHQLINKEFFRLEGIPVFWHYFTRFITLTYC